MMATFAKSDIRHFLPPGKKLGEMDQADLMGAEAMQEFHD